MKSILIDDFREEVNFRFKRSILELHQAYGVKIIERDVIVQEIEFKPETIDAITTFDSVEHWHNSPKKLFASVMNALAPGGVVVIGVPNCVNLRKRITVPFGFGKWSSMNDWYESEVFRGHVREPDVDDLHYIARDMGLVDVQIYGRNWLGYISPNRVIRFASLLTDRALQLYPPLCSNIYMVGRKSS
jgi:SAM-dependent methyltransferase